MKSQLESRRDFLKTGGSVFGASWLAVNLPLVLSACRAAREKLESGAGFENLTTEEVLEITAIVEQIIPKDETPGASETGVVYFIDEAFADFMSAAAPMIRLGLEDLNKRSESLQVRAKVFADLSFEQQKQLLTSIEDTAFFGTMHFMTMCGMFCLPEYGGNRDYAGWSLLGFDHRHAWQPPFGHYDAAVHGDTDSQGDDHEHG